MTIGERLKKARKSKNMSMKDLSIKTKISDGNICNLENNKAQPNAKTIIELCKELNITTDWLLNGTESEKSLTKEQKEILDLYENLDNKAKGYIYYKMIDLIENLDAKK